MEEIQSMAQILNVMVQGTTLAFKVTKGTLELAERFMKLILNMLEAPFKGSKAVKDYAVYHKETGSTNFKNLNMRANGDLTCVKLERTLFDKDLKRALKKAGILYTAAPLFKGGSKDSIFLMISSADLARLQFVLENVKEDYIAKQTKHGMKREQAEEIFKEKNSIVTVDEMMQGIGATGEFDDFVSQIESIFGKDYSKDVVQEENVYQAEENMGFSKASGWVPTAEMNERMEELARAFKESQKNGDRKTVGITFEHNPNDPESSHIVGQTEDYIKVQLNEKGRACVMLPKEAVDGDLAKESKTGTFTAHIPEDMEILVADLDEKNAAVSMTAKEFIEKYKDWEKSAMQEKERPEENRRTAAKKTAEKGSRTTGSQVKEKADIGGKKSR